jgi:hypothetical protein
MNRSDLRELASLLGLQRVRAFECDVGLLPAEPTEAAASALSALGELPPAQKAFFG